jgi:hypothetical protein
MFTHTRITFAAAFILAGVSSALPDVQALASNNYDSPDWTPAYAVPRATYCPTLEGYPDCHPDSHASWDQHSVTPTHPLSGRSAHPSRP